MGKAGIRFAVAVLCTALSAVPATSTDRGSIELAAARIVGKHGLGVDITENTRQVDPLHWAAINDQPETIARVIESGVPVDLRDGQGRTALMVAAAFGNATAAEALIAHGADVLATDALDGNEALHFAAVAGRIEVARILLRHGARLDARGPHDETPLHYAALYGQRRMISFLVANGAYPDVADNNGIRPIQYAYRRRQDAAADLLLELRATPDNLHDAVNAGDTARVQYFLAHGTDADERDASWSTPLDLAAATGQVAIAVMLLDAGADIEAADEPARMHPLHLAAIGDHPEMAELLIDRGANPDSRDSLDRTPLMVAATYGRAATASKLVTLGSDLFADDTICGGTALHFAAKSGSIEVARLLLEAGVDVNTRGGSSGEPPLHTAASWGQLEMISLLIANGADPNMPDNAGWTPVRLVSRHLPERQVVVALLRKYGARD